MSGSKPGERRGGRQKGTPNLKTTERRLLEKRAQDAGGRVVEDKSAVPMIQAAERLDRERGDLLGREVINVFMKLWMGRAAHFQPKPKVKEDGKTWYDSNPNGNEGLFEKYSRLAVDAGAKLAPYQSPQYRAIFVAPPPAQPTNGDGVKRYTLTVVDNFNGRTIEADMDRPDENGRD